MSLFQSTSLTCPACGLEQSFDAVMSVNADRRPDLRTAILANEFQRHTCSRCAAPLRLDPDFSLLDQAQGLWISAAPLAALGQWAEREALAQATFDEGYGPGASKGAQAIGGRLRVRVTFGWAALREKLYAADQGIDDVVLEMTKAAALRSGAPASLGRTTELRLVGIEGNDLLLQWIDAVDQEGGDVLRVARTLYDQIASDNEGRWQALRNRVSGGPFVDLNRSLVAQPA